MSAKDARKGATNTRHRGKPGGRAVVEDGPGLDPTRPPWLVEKYHKLLGTAIEKLTIEYTGEGIKIRVLPMGAQETMSLAQFHLSRSSAQELSPEAKHRAFAKKALKRLSKTVEISSSDDMISFLRELGDAEKRIMRLTNSEWSKQQKESAAGGAAEAPRVRTTTHAGRGGKA